MLCDKCHYTSKEVLARVTGSAPGLRSMRATAKRCAMPPPNEWPVTYMGTFSTSSGPSLPGNYVSHALHNVQLQHLLATRLVCSELY